MVVELCAKRTANRTTQGTDMTCFHRQPPGSTRRVSASVLAGRSLLRFHSASLQPEGRASAPVLQKMETGLEHVTHLTSPRYSHPGVPAWKSSRLGRMSQVTGLEKTFAEDIADKGLLSRKYKELLKLNNKMNNLVLKWAKRLNRHLTKEDRQMTSVERE